MSSLSDTSSFSFPETRSTETPGEESAYLHLELIVRDQNVIAELETQRGEDREQFALDALRIGVLALKQARGQVDADAVRRESERMLETLEHQLTEHSRLLNDRMTIALKEYFDPQDGRLTERVNRLVKQDGELEQVLRKQIGSEDSELLKTLSQNFGPESALMKMLNPEQSTGLLAILRQTMEEQLQQQREHVLGQFSLDNKEGALARFIDELTDKQGQLSEKLHDRIEVIAKEFSLDQEDSALSRLVQNVERAQRTITNEFSLDEESSALSRLKKSLDQTNKELHGQLSLDDEKSALSILKRELLQLMEESREHNQKFQEEIKLTLQEMVVRKKEAARSTQHGIQFEDAVFEYVLRKAQQANDIATRTGNTTGLIKNRKVGDCVIDLGRESAAPGAKIVLEAKEATGYDINKALEESELARKNRGAQIGIFVFSSQSAPDVIEPFSRYGDDLVVIWDAEDANTDVYLNVALSVAKALCIRQQGQSEQAEFDFDKMDKAILEIEKRANNLEEIEKSAQTIQNGANKILKNVELSRKSLLTQVESLQDATVHVKEILRKS
ncbi:MAG: hypothetical protein KDA65_18050 [Planctomycetaceae bacterium]|nr:hypothetical protein [Planctomycetaceae bacterium]